MKAIIHNSDTMSIGLTWVAKEKGSSVANYLLPGCGTSTSREVDGEGGIQPTEERRRSDSFGELRNDEEGHISRSTAGKVSLRARAIVTAGSQTNR